MCDGTSDCTDGSDESDCFTCDTGSTVIRNTQVCDSAPDCSDGSDEGSCFTCDNFDIIPMNLTLVFFRAADTPTALYIIKGMFCNAFC